MQIPLADIGGQDIVDIDFESADQRARIRCGAHHALIKNSGRMDPVT